VKKDRLAFMVEDSKVRSSSPSRLHVATLPEKHAAQVVCLDTDADAIASLRVACSGISCADQHVIYTSGSRASQGGGDGYHGERGASVRPPRTR
jgi:hypothetical protein